MRFFSVIWEGRTYLNLLYLILSFPLGLFYFTVLVTGISTGLGLLIIIWGIPILGLMVLVWWGFAYVERTMAINMLGVKVPSMGKETKGNWWKKYKALLKNPVTWKSLLFVFLKFPVGLSTFILITVAFSVTVSFISAPVLYWLVKAGALTSQVMIGKTPMIEFPVLVFLMGIFGIILFFVFFHLCNGLAYLHGILARALLGK